jgi:hypothetical protein
MTRTILALLLTLVLVAPCFAATAVQVEFMANGVHDRQGNLLVGGKVWTYSAGTNLPKETYLDRNALTPASNPIVLDGEGKAVIFASGSYKFVIQDADGAAIKIMDGFTYRDASEALSSALTVSTTTDPQFTIQNGAYTTTLGLGATGDTVLKPSGDFYLENATPRLILDNTSKQITMGMNATSGYLTLTPGLQLVNGAGSATLAADTASRLVVSSPLSIQHSPGVAALYETTSTGDVLITTNNLTASGNLSALGNLSVTGTSAFSGAVGFSGNATFSGDAYFPNEWTDDAFTLNSPAWVCPTGSGNFVRVGRSYPAGAGGFVVMGGLYLSDGTSNTVGMLKPEYAPAFNAYIPVTITNAPDVKTAIMTIASSGEVTLAFYGGATPANLDALYLDGITYSLPRAP